MSLSIEHISKNYGTQKVLNDVSFSLSENEIVGFLGPNGAGKSSTMKIISGFLHPDKGAVSICGVDILKQPLEAKRNIGYLPEHNPLYLDMYVREYLEFASGFYDLGKNRKNKIDEMIERTGLTEEYRKKIRQLSKGFRQRVGLAQALIHDPKVLILDEPTTGLDPNQLIEIRHLIREIGREKTVLFSTHIMQEVKALCDRVIIINKGSIVADHSDIKAVLPESKKRIFYIEFDKPFLGKWEDISEEITSAAQTGSYTYELESKIDIRATIFQYASQNNLMLLTIKEQTQPMDVEKIFVELTK